MVVYAKWDDTEVTTIAHGWKMGSMKPAERLCRNEYCKVHSFKIRNRSKIPRPCIVCGIGVRSEIQLCRGCGRETERNRLNRLNKIIEAWKPNYKNIVTVYEKQWAVDVNECLTKVIKKFKKILKEVAMKKIMWWYLAQNQKPGPYQQLLVYQKTLLMLWDRWLQVANILVKKVFYTGVKNNNIIQNVAVWSSRYFWPFKPPFHLFLPLSSLEQLDMLYLWLLSAKQGPKVWW